MKVVTFEWWLMLKCNIVSNQEALYRKSEIKVGRMAALVCRMSYLQWCHPHKHIGSLECPIFWWWMKNPRYQTWLCGTPQMHPKSLWMIIQAVFTCNR